MRDTAAAAADAAASALIPSRAVRLQLACLTQSALPKLRASHDGGSQFITDDVRGREEGEEATAALNYLQVFFYPQKVRHLSGHLRTHLHFSPCPCCTSARARSVQEMTSRITASIGSSTGDIGHGSDGALSRLKLP